MKVVDILQAVRGTRFLFLQFHPLWRNRIDLKLFTNLEVAFRMYLEKSLEAYYSGIGLSLFSLHKSSNYRLVAYGLDF